MSVSGGYNGALQWMLAHGWTKDDLDQFLAGNPGDWGRVDSAFGNDSPHSIAAQSGGVHAAPGVVLPDIPAPNGGIETATGTGYYAPATPVGAPRSAITSSPDDGKITASAILPAINTPGGGAVSVDLSGNPFPAAAGIPTWVYVVGAAAVLWLLFRR